MRDGSVQVVARVGTLLRALGSSPTRSTSASELARLTGLTRPTTQRLLQSLAAEGLVDQGPDGRGWRLGPELYLLGSTAATTYDITEHSRDLLAHLADSTGESAYLSAVRGQQTICLLEEEGSFPLRSHVLHTGVRFPLGVASAGLAVLAHLPSAETDTYIAGVDLTPQWGRKHARAALRRRVTATRLTGYAVNPGLVVEGSWGLGAAVFDRTGRPAWALSLTGVEARLREPRQQRLGKLLLDHAHRLTQRLR